MIEDFILTLTILKIVFFAAFGIIVSKFLLLCIAIIVKKKRNALEKSLDVINSLRTNEDKIIYAKKMIAADIERLKRKL